MGFPLDIRTELFIGGTWLDVSPDVYLREVKNIVRGLRDQGSTADPASLSLTLNNRAGKYSPRNAMSPLYGLIGRNTPLRLSVPSEESYLQLDGRDGCEASTPDSASLDITGDIDVRAEISPDWYGSTNQLIIGKWDSAALQSSWFVQVYNGSIYFRYTISGNESAGGRWFARGLPALPERAAIRVTMDVDNGRGGNTVTFYWAESLDAPNGWTMIQQPVTVTAGTSPIFSGTAPLRIGVTDPKVSGRRPMTGRGYRFEVRNGIDGPVVASPDFRVAAPGSASVTDAQGNVWTLSGSAQVRDRADRFVGEVASWPLRWSTDDADIWTPITANGILRRLGQGTKALDSTLRRRIPSGNPIAYWPMEELTDAVQAYSPIPGVQPASVSSVDWASADSLPSSAPLPRLTGESSLSAPVPDAEPGQWHVEMVYNADKKIPMEDVEFLKILSGNGTIRQWVIFKRNTLVTVEGYNAAGTRVVWQGAVVGADIFNDWTRFRFFAYDADSGGTFTWRIEWQDPGGDAGGLSGTVTGTCGSVSMVSADWPALTEGWAVGHLAVLREAGSALYTGSDNAYLGETALTRMRRLAVEEGLTLTRTPGRLSTEAVGFQRRDSLLSLLEAAADADGGMLTEDMDRIGLRYRDRSSLYAQEPAITLSYTSAGLGPDLEPVDDDSATVNDVTVVRDGGSAGRAVLEEGPLSVQPAPDGIGKYDASYTVSLARDDQAAPHAHWRLHKGTWDAARFPTVSLLLHKPGAEWLIPLVRKLREGDKVRITDLPEWVSHDDVDLIVLGWTERLDMYRWELDLNCVPAGPWDTALTDAAIADTDGSAVAQAATASATSLVVRTTEGPLWADDPLSLPYDVRVAGEHMRVMSVGELVDTGDPYMTTGAAWTGASSTVGWQNGVTLPNGKVGGVVQVTPNGTSEFGDGVSPMSAAGSVTPGRRYRVGMWVYAPNGLSDFRPAFYNYNAAGTYLGTAVAPAQAIPAGVWTWTQYDFTAAANTVRGKVRGRWGGTPSAQPIYLWGARMFAVSGQSVSDEFTRTVTDGWGTSDSGHDYLITGGAAATRFAVNGSQGQHIMGTRSLFYTTSLPTVQLTDVDFSATVTVPVMPTGDGVYTYALVRTNADATNYYFARIWCKTTGVAELSLRKRTPTESLLATYGTTLTHTAGQGYRVRISAVGSTIRAKFWRTQDSEPRDWQLVVTDAELAGPGGVGVRSYISSTNTNTLPVTTAFDALQVNDSQHFAVARSLNGVVKAQPVGASVSVANPAVVSL